MPIWLFFVDNIALKLPVKANYNLAEVSALVDGIHSTSHLQMRIPPWFMIFLIRPYQVKQIKVIRDKDAVEIRSYISHENSLLNYADVECDDNTVIDSLKYVMICPLSAKGVYIKMNIKKKNAFVPCRLREIEIYGERIMKHEHEPNIAFQKPVSVSKPTSSCSSKLTDESIFTMGAAIAADDTGTTWISIDLLGFYTIESFISYKFQVHDNLAHDLDFHVGRDFSRNPNDPSWELCTKYRDVNIRKFLVASCSSPAPIGRFGLIVQRKSRIKAIRFVGVEIFGTFANNWNSEIISHSLISTKMLNFHKSSSSENDLWKVADSYPYSNSFLATPTCVEISSWFLITFSTHCFVYNVTVVPKCSESQSVFDNLELSIVNHYNYELNLNDYPNNLLRCPCWRSYDHDPFPIGNIIYADCMNICYGKSLLAYSKSSKKIKLCEIYAFGKKENTGNIEPQLPDYIIFNNTLFNCRDNLTIQSNGKTFTIWLKNYAKFYGLSMRSISSKILSSMSEQDLFELCNQYNYQFATNNDNLSIFCRNPKVARYIKFENTDVDICSIKILIEYTRTKLSNTYQRVNSLSKVPYFKHTPMESIKICANICKTTKDCETFEWSIKTKICSLSKYVLTNTPDNKVTNKIIFSRSIHDLPEAVCI